MSLVLLLSANFNKLRNKLQPKTISALKLAHRFISRHVGNCKIFSRLVLAAKKWKVKKNKQKKMLLCFPI
jgi:hypothetical protein